MPAPRVLILRAPGTNCDAETAFAFEQAGGDAAVVHINQLRDDPRRLRDVQIFCIPGGFSYGDDVAAGRILALELNRFAGDLLHEFLAADKLVLGICNGFQTLLKAGILTRDCDEPAAPAATLTWNDHGRYEDRWVRLEVGGSRSVFLRGIESLELPIAHAEGKFVARDEAMLRRLDQEGRLALRYAMRRGRFEPAALSGDGPRAEACGDVRPSDDACRALSSVAEACSGEGSTARLLPFPHNPNGSQGNVAGLCDATGRAMGLMPHPERYIFAEQHPRWTRGDDRPEQRGMRIFENAVGWFG